MKTATEEISAASSSKVLEVVLFSRCVAIIDGRKFSESSHFEAAFEVVKYCCRFVDIPSLVTD